MLTLHYINKLIKKLDKINRARKPSIKIFQKDEFQVSFQNNVLKFMTFAFTRMKYTLACNFWF